MQNVLLRLGAYGKLAEGLCRCAEDSRLEVVQGLKRTIVRAVKSLRTAHPYVQIEALIMVNKPIDVIRYFPACIF